MTNSAHNLCIHSKSTETNCPHIGQMPLAAAQANVSTMKRKECNPLNERVRWDQKPESQ